MKRQVTMEEISDGRLYTSGDLVKAECGDCVGCSDCCRGMGNSIVLDPFDVQRLADGLKKTFAELLAENLELHLVDRIILPNLKLAEGSGEACSFLNQEGRCRIHSLRPGICRIFPLGRLYEDGDMRYFLQIHECSRPNRTKVKVKKWVDQPDLKAYEAYIVRWHYFLERLEETILKAPARVACQKRFCTYVLDHFYRSPFLAPEGFYQEFEDRIRQAEQELLSEKF